MEISNFYGNLSITDVQEKAAPVGNSLRVAVTKTSAQGKSVQSATPNLMSFSTDENSIWFNKKNYGAVVFKNLFGLSTSSSNEEIKTALGGNTYNDISQMVDRGILFLNINNKALQHVMIRVENTGSSEGDYLHIRAFSDASNTAYIKIRHYNGVFNITQDPIRSNIVFRSDIIDELGAPLSDYPLSANMGKKLNDEKLPKSFVVNNLTTTDANKALSAVQGKALNDKISSLNTKLSSNIIVINTNSLPENVTTEDQVINEALGVSGTELYNAFKSGATIVDSGDNIIYPSLVEPNHIIFNVLYLLDKPTVYTKMVELKFSSTGQYSSCTVTSKEYPIPVVENSLSSNNTANALSAAQGKALNDKISALGSVYRIKGSKTNISEVLALTDAKVGDVWNVINAFTLNGKPFPASTNIVCITATSSSDHDEGNWDPIGGTVNLSAYVPKSDIVNAVTSQDTNKPLSAAQGYKLQTEKFAKNDVKSSYDSSTSTVYSTQYLNNREEDFEEDVRATVGPIYIPLHEGGTKTIQQQSITSDFTLVWLSDMKKIVAKSSSGSYYNNWKIENDLNPSNRDALLVVKDTTTNSPITGHIYILGDYSYRWNGSNFIQIDKTPLPTDYHCYINGLPRLANSIPSSLEEVFGSFDNFKRGIESSKAIWVDTMYSGDIICSRRTLDNVTCAIFEGALTLRTSGTAEKDAYSGVYYIQCVIKYNSSGFLGGSTVKLYEDSIMPYYITDFPEKASNDGGRTDMDAFLGTLKDFEAAFKAGRPFRLLQSSETNTSSSNIIIVSKRSGAHSYYVQRIFATNLSDSRTCTKLHVINPASDGGTKWEGYSVLINTELVPLSRVVDSLDSTSLYPLSANQGKQLKSLIDKVKTGIIIE